MDKTAALERLSKLESEAAELRKIIEQPEEVGLWVPEKEGGYFYAFDTGKINSTTNQNGYDEARIANGNCFMTQSIARKASALQRKFNFYIQACFQADPDAGEWSEERRFAIYFCAQQWVAHEHPLWIDRICCHTFEQAAEACRLLNAWQAKEDAK